LRSRLSSAQAMGPSIQPNPMKSRKTLRIPMTKTMMPRCGLSLAPDAAVDSPKTASLTVGRRPALRFPSGRHILGGLLGLRAGIMAGEAFVARGRFYRG
jgi:hypothetical protein